MIAELKPYSEYKESGLPWLGKVPGHWETRRLKTVARLNPSKSESASLLRDNAVATFLPMERVGTDGQIDVREKRPASSLWNGFTYFRRNDVLLAKITPCFENGKGACLSNLPTEIGFGSTEFHVLRPRSELSPRFLYLQTCLAVFRDLGARSMTGSAGQQRVPSRFVEEHQAIIPPPAEQAAIVRFLDWANERLERAIRGKRKVIALLNEQKQAIIHRAVTCGLDPSVPLKPSGIPWLGDIPQHWGIVRNLALFSHRIEQGIPGLPVLQVSLHSGITAEELDQFGRPKRLIADHTKYKLIRKHDLAYNTMRMWQGAVGVCPTDGLVSPAYVVIRPRTGSDPAFYEFVFRTAVYKQEVNRHSTGIVSDRNRLYWESFKQMPNVLLPIDEQQEICRFIQEATSGLNTAISRLEREIELLREYRARLVADVVTGKLDVREAAARLPEEVAADIAVDDTDLSDETESVDDEATV